MEIKNRMEDVVINTLDTILKKYPNCCTCEQCKKDIVVFALNHLPPKYVSTHKGDVFVRLEETYTDNTIKVIEEIIKAIELVSRHPNHKKAS